MKRNFALLLTAAWISSSAVARGEPSSADRALATELFKQGRELMTAGKIADACEKFEESQRLDPGGGTALNLGICHEKLGRLATAWTELTEALGFARRDGRSDREELAREHIAAIEPRLSRLVIDVPPAVRVPGLTVRRDGSPVGHAAWGVAMPVDGGWHNVDAVAPGYARWSTSIEVRAEADTKSVEVPSLTAQQKVEPPAAAPRVKPKRVAPVHERKPEDPGELQRSLGFGLGAMGLVAIGIGSYFAVQAFREQHQSEANCPNLCTAEGASLANNAAHHADDATAALSVGAIGVAVGTYLVLSAPSPSTAPRVGVRASPRGFVLDGRF